MMKNKFGLIIVACLLLTSCADVSHVQECLQPTEHTYGFWGGTWHGMIMGFSFIGSLFSDDIAIYAVNNNGAWYDFGYIGGFWMLLKILRGLINNLKK
jgi:hypothetical protein